MPDPKLQILYWGLSVFFIGVNAFFAIRSTINALKNGKRLNQEQKKDNAKHELFLSLFSLRGSPVDKDFVAGLNKIDVVFQDTPTVLSLWHKHFDSMQVRNQVNEDKIWEHQRAKLLSEMAVKLGYGSIDQMEILRHYYPEGHQNQRLSDIEFQEIQTQYYKAGALACYYSTIFYKQHLNIKDGEDNLPTPP